MERETDWASTELLVKFFLSFDPLEFYRTTQLSETVYETLLVFITLSIKCILHFTFPGIEKDSILTVFEWFFLENLNVYVLVESGGMIEEGEEQDNILQMEEGIKQSEY